MVYTSSISQLHPLLWMIMANLLFKFLFIAALTTGVAAAQLQPPSNITSGSMIYPDRHPTSWSSPSGLFAFGFYQQGDGFRIGIWLQSKPQITVVWTADRDAPPVHSDSYLVFATGKLILWTKDNRKVIVDSSKSATSRASMLDSGNFVIYNNHTRVIWQSFDLPTDTLLVGQHLELNNRLVSSVSASDTSSGRFFLSMQGDGNLIAYPLDSLSRPEDSYWGIAIQTRGEFGGVNGAFVSIDRSGQLFMNISNSDHSELRSIANRSSSDNTSNRSVIYRATLDPDGILRLYSHRFGGNNGLTVMIEWSALENQCQVNRFCGVNSFCKAIKGGKGDCSCFPGFQYFNHRNIVQLLGFCLEGSRKLLVYEFMSKGTLADIIFNTTMRPFWKQRVKLARDIAQGILYLEVNVTTADEILLSNWVSKCFVEDNLRPSIKGVVLMLEGTMDIPLCLPARKEDATIFRIIADTNLTWDDPPYFVSSILGKEDCSKSCSEDCDCDAALYDGSGHCTKHKLPLRYVKSDTEGSKNAFFKVSNTMIASLENDHVKPPWLLILFITLGSVAYYGAAIAFSGFFIFKFRILQYRKLLQTGNKGLTKEFILRTCTYKELKRATNGFKEELGKGSFGVVYRGSFDKGKTLVAVKRLEKVVEEGEREFRAEMRAIGRTRHKNLVRLLGYCAEGSKRLLVYEYMSNGCLANLLFKAKQRPDWTERLRIALNVARGIHYLHEECEAPIIHCDIKPQNILLDDCWIAKISDFGLAKLLMPDQTRTFTGVRGTRGYLAPEWQTNAPISVKVDTYSFGIVLLEIICLQRMVAVAIWCIQDEPALRPSMKQVLQMLEGLKEVPIPPCPSACTS